MSANVIYIVIGVAGVALIAAILIASWLLWQRQARLALIGLTGRREAVMAAYKALESLFAALAESGEDELTDFALHEDNEHRRSLEELYDRMRVQTEELVALPLPKAQWHAADMLSLASGKLASEVGRVGDATSPDGVLDAVGSIDVVAVKQALDPANEEIDRLLELYGVEDVAVYGGGLYI